jgi:hypothetical protein
MKHVFHVPELMRFIAAFRLVYKPGNSSLPIYVCKTVEVSTRLFSFAPVSVDNVTQNCISSGIKPIAMMFETEGEIISLRCA